MDSLHSEQEIAPPAITADEREQVREQMERLLETHHFRNSRRYPALLRFVVEETLDGRGPLLKERLVGMRVFDRPADYDTASDPIVRVTIAEVRKRIAQYYHDEEHDAEIRIELQPGRYAPEFRLRRELATEPLAPPIRTPGALDIPWPGLANEGPESTTPTSAATEEPPRKGRSSRWPALALSLIVCLGAAAYLYLQRDSELDRLWRPVLAGSQPITFVLPTDLMKTLAEKALEDTAATAGSQRSPTFLIHEQVGENVVFSDVLATLHLVSLLDEQHRSYRVRLTKTTTLDDLRQGPAILVGGLDNPWTMRALAPLRYHFAGDTATDERYWIADAQQPAMQNWSLNLKQSYTAVTRDYAIVARIHNEQTGQAQVIVAGIGMSGTAAAGQFLADEKRVAELHQRLGSCFRSCDFEAVLSTDVVNGAAGEPHILAIVTR